MNLTEIDLRTYRLLNLQAESWEVLGAASEHLRQVVGVEIAPVARDRRWWKLFGAQSVVSWLAGEADISTERAAEIIQGFPIHVAPRMNQIAMNPSRFLGLASSIARTPDAIVFSTSGMDRLGVENLHNYATTHFSGTLVHLDVSACEYCRVNGDSFDLCSRLMVVAR